MSMTKEQFLQLGLTEELAAKAAEESKKELESFIPKSRFDEVNTAKKKAEDDVKSRDKQIEELKKVDAEGLKAKIEELQEANKESQKQYNKELAQIKLTNALKLAIQDAQDVDLVINQLDTSKLKLSENGTLEGLKEQLDPLKESKGFLFKQEQQQQAPQGGFKPNQSNTNVGGVITKETFSKMSYKEKVELYNTNQELYTQLINE